LGEWPVRLADHLYESRQARGERTDTLHLGCVHGFLLGYYESLGFERLDRKVLEYPFGSFDMVLMKRDLPAVDGASATL
jgi:hypothetical protein